MKRFAILTGMLVAALAMTAVALADPGDRGKNGKAGHAKFTFTMQTTDNGCAGNPWANDTEIGRAHV